MEKKHSKRYRKEEELFDKNTSYTPQEALDIIKKMKPVKFDAAVEVHAHLGTDPKNAEHIVRGSVVLPHGTGKTKKVVAFVTADKVNEAKEAGADIIGDDEFIQQIKTTGVCDFDIAIALPTMMKKLGPVARILGQKGLMPNPKTETVTTNVAKTLSELKKGKVTFRSDDSSNIHQSIGRVSFDAAKLSENFDTFIDALKKAKPDTFKGTFLRSVTVSATMGPSIRVKV